jgi:hypothetical protein
MISRSLLILSLAGLILFYGCSKQNKVSDMDILYSDGKGCVFHAKGMSIEQSEEIKKKWSFKDCDVDVIADDEGALMPPIKH